MCILRVCVLRVYTSAPRKWWNQKAGVNRNACVHFACVRFSQLPPDVGFQSLFLGHCATNVAALGGRSKAERLSAFCVCAFCASWYLDH